MKPLNVTLVTLITLASSAAAAPQTLNPANGHYYEFVAASVSFSQARAAADAATFQGVQGHLATIADAAENSFVFGLAPNGAWLGGFQDTTSLSYSEPLGGWSWVTGEPFSFSAWANNEPNGASAGQDYLELWDIGQWNDTNDQSNPFNSGYVIEYDTGVQPAFNPANGNSYLVVDAVVCWDEARTAAEAMTFQGAQGHLVTITSDSERDFVNGIMPPGRNRWLGGYQDLGASDYSEPAGGWRWTTGEPFNYSNWSFSEPSDGGGAGEAFLELYGTSFAGNGWNDNVLCSSITGGYIVEFEGSLGTVYCLSNPNSTGVRGLTSVIGSLAVSDNDMTLVAEQLPNNVFGFFVQSRNQGYLDMPGGSEGALCLGANIGRYIGFGQILNTVLTGSISIPIDLMSMPTALGTVVALPGETWNFQAWHRDSNGGTATSNFTNGVSVVLQ